jgi:peroxiredoxin Q/BCP
MLRPGEVAPSWSGVSSSGERLTLSSLRGRPVVLYFYPRAGTTGCRIETEGFARHYPEFQKAGVAVVGISVDPLERQRQFSEECRVPFPLIADADASIARAYGVLGLLGVARRITFWIDAEGRIVDVIQGMLPGPHLRGALERLVALQHPATRPSPGRDDARDDDSPS